MSVCIQVVIVLLSIFVQWSFSPEVGTLLFETVWRLPCYEPLLRRCR